MGNRGKASPSVFISEFDRMENTIKKSDFVLTPYMQSSDWRGAVQVLNTIGPYVLLWWLAVQVMSISVWLLPPVVGLLTLFSIRCFSLMHDCGHHSLFKSEWLNRVAGFLFGVINAIPQYPWSRGHAYHHKTNGDWQRYRGPSGLASTEEFTAFTPTADDVPRWLLLLGDQAAHGADPGQHSFFPICLHQFEARPAPESEANGVVLQSQALVHGRRVLAFTVQQYLCGGRLTLDRGRDRLCLVLWDLRLCPDDVGGGVHLRLLCPTQF
jgi:hypothetical protein